MPDNSFNSVSWSPSADESKRLMREWFQNTATGRKYSKVAVVRAEIILFLFTSFCSLMERGGTVEDAFQTFLIINALLLVFLRRNFCPAIAGFLYDLVPNKVHPLFSTSNLPHSLELTDDHLHYSNEFEDNRIR